MPPCGDVQQDVAADLVAILVTWAHAHIDFVAGSNEAGMKLGDDVRGADGAIWRRVDLAGYTGGYRRVAPVLAVEIAGQDEGERELREKAQWYLRSGVLVVWLILPETREVIVLHKSGETRCPKGERLPAHAALPDLTPEVGAFFIQLDRT